MNFPIHPDAGLDEAERELLSKYGNWLQSLANESRQPETPDQERFVKVSKGYELPTTAFENAWVKHSQAAASAATRISPADLAAQLQRAHRARSASLAVQQIYADRRAEILKQVQDQLDAVDAEFQQRLTSTAEEATKQEEAAKNLVFAFGMSFYAAGVKATFYRGRVTFDSQRMQEYARTHPEVNEFRKVSAAHVRIAYPS